MEGYIQALIDAHTRNMNMAVQAHVYQAESRVIEELKGILAFYKKIETGNKFKKDIKEALKGVKMKNVSIKASNEDFDLDFIKAIGR